MLSAALPEYFDPNSLAREAFSTCVDVPVSEFPRLADLLISSIGMVQVTLAGSMSADQRPTMRIGLQATLEQSCQRCLKPVTVVVDHTHTVEWVADAAELDRLDGSEEYLDQADWEFLPMPVPPKVRTLDLVEDELILSLPLVPFHEVCALPVAPLATTEDHPFAALARLKGLN